MQIDWLTVAAQIANFLVLVWLLQRFLYRPITDAMARREARIEERLSDAKARRREAEEEAESLRNERTELEGSRQEMLDEARVEADELKQRLEQDIRDEIDSKRAAWQKALVQERADTIAGIQRNAGHKVLDIAARILADFTGSELADQVARGFVTQMNDLDTDTRKKLVAAADGPDATALVQSAVALDASARRRITRAIHAQFETDIEVDYREVEDVLVGLRLTIGEQTVEWSAARYLERLHRELDDLLQPTGAIRRQDTTT